MLSLDSSCRLSSAQSHNAKWDTGGSLFFAAANPSVSQSPTSPALVSGLPAPHRSGNAAGRAEVIYPHHTPSITQPPYPFKSIHVLKNLEKPCCLNGLILSKVPGIDFHFHLWTFYSAPNTETYSTTSTHSSLLSHVSLSRGFCSSPNDRDSSAVTGCRTRHLWKSHFRNRKYSL